MRWKRRPKTLASPSKAARSAASIGAQGCAGAGSTGGLSRAGRTSPQKDHRRHPLHRTARGVDDQLYRRTRESRFHAALLPLLAGPPLGTASRRRSTPVVVRKRGGSMARCVSRRGRNSTRSAPARTSTHSIALLADSEAATPTGDLSLITDNLVPPRQRPDPCLAGRASTPAPGLYSDGSVVAQRAGGVVAPVSAGGLRWAELCRCERDRRGAAGGHQATQSPRQALGVGTTTAHPPPTASALLLSPLRNAALEAVREASPSGIKQHGDNGNPAPPPRVPSV
jgi:hypothetical protein